MNALSSPAVISAEDTSPERKLWASVLMRGIEDAIGNATSLNGPTRTNSKSVTIYRAEGWIGSKDFEIVASLAGLDPVAVAERLRPALELPVKERLAWWRRQLATASGTQKPYTGVCKAEGCETPVHKNSRTGLCREHAHEDGVCECGYCRRHKAGKWAVAA